MEARTRDDHRLRFAIYAVRHLRREVFDHDRDLLRDRVLLEVDEQTQEIGGLPAVVPGRASATASRSRCTRMFFVGAA